MNNTSKRVVVALLALCCCLPLKAENLLLAGSGWGKVAIIDKQSREVVWEHPLQKGWECNNAVALKDGNVLFSYKRGAKVVTLDHKDVWDIPAPEGTEMQSARVLPNGNCLISWCGNPLVIMEVEPKSGKILSKTEYDTGIKNPHAQMRQVSKHTDGNYIIPIVSGGAIHIVSPEGKLVRNIKLEVGPFAVTHIKGDRYWVAGGDAHSLLEVDFATGETIRTIKDGDINGAPFFFIGGLEQGKKGLYVCNWQGHAKGKTGPKVFEFNKKMKMVWSVKADDKGIGRVSAVASYPYPIKK